MRALLFNFTQVASLLFVCGLTVFAAVRCVRKLTAGRCMFLVGLFVLSVGKVVDQVDAWVRPLPVRAEAGLTTLNLLAVLSMVLGMTIAGLGFYWLALIEKD